MTHTDTQIDKRTTQHTHCKNNTGQRSNTHQPTCKCLQRMTNLTIWHLIVCQATMQTLQIGNTTPPITWGNHWLSPSLPDLQIVLFLVPPSHINIKQIVMNTCTHRGHHQQTNKHFRIQQSKKTNTHSNIIIIFKYTFIPTRQTNKYCLRQPISIQPNPLNKIVNGRRRPINNSIQNQ